MTGGCSHERRLLLLCRAGLRVARLKIFHEQSPTSREETGEFIGL
jgi:hypothetical protein